MASESSIQLHVRHDVYTHDNYSLIRYTRTVYPKKYAHGFVVLCFVVVMQSFIMNSHEAFIHIHQGCFAGTGAIVRLPQCQWSKPDGYGKISQRVTATKHSKAKTVCIFLGIYCTILQCHWILSYCMNCCLKLITIKLIQTSKYFDIIHSIFYGTMTRNVVNIFSWGWGWGWVGWWLGVDPVACHI